MKKQQFGSTEEPEINDRCPHLYYTNDIYKVGPLMLGSVGPLTLLSDSLSSASPLLPIVEEVCLYFVSISARRL